MHLISQRRLRVGLAAVSAALLGAVTLGAPAVSAETYSTPSAPGKITVSQATGGLKVQWAGAKGSPAITNYIVSGGAGSCPVIVPASARSAYMPALSTDPMTVTVQAVNEYGISNPVATDTLVTPATVSTKHKSVQILQLSDFHGQLEANNTFGASLLASNLKVEREIVEATFTVSSGDNIGAAPPISSQFAELPTIQVMNTMGFDVSAFGNHEHDRPLQHLRTMIRYSNFEWVASNYSSLRGTDAGNGKRAKSYTVIERDGVKVGFIGINTSQTKEQIMPGNLDFTYNGKSATVEIIDNAPGIQTAVAAARAAGAHVVVALIHEGWNTNLNGKAVGPLIDYAKSLKDVDVVYGAHSHLTYSSVLGGRLVAQTKNAGAEYNRTQVCVDTAAGKVIGASNELVTPRTAIVTAGADTATSAVITRYKSNLNARMDVKVGRVAVVTPIGGTPPVQRSGEHAFGNWSADVVRAKYGTDFALMNGGGIRTSFPATTYVPADKTLVRPSATQTEGPWDIVLGDVYTIHPFGNVFSTIEVTGAQIWAAMENGVSRYPADGRWPHVSGMKFTVDVTKPVGSRIVELVDLTGKAIPKDNTRFTLALTDFVAKGGDGYNMFDISKLNVRDLDADVLVEALRADAAAGKVTEMKLDGRTTVIK
jgi:2',3'-cyclic-nucleotide 2'-phosphodiesterase (5'-nucleotidase family)